MAIIAFWSEEKNETGQTLSMVALSTYMDIEHNYRILNVSTNFRDSTLEDCYWNYKQDNTVANTIANTITGSGNVGTTGFESGIEGVVKLINSNRTSGCNLKDYSRVIFNDRLDILCSPKTTDYNEYYEIAKKYPDILRLANSQYDLVFIDISKKMDREEVNDILEVADVIVMNITQKLAIINKFSKLREENKFFKNNNIILNIGRYDIYSKYNVTNIARFLKMKRGITNIPYNTLYFEVCSEGRVSEFFWKMRKLDEDDRNYVFVQDVANMSKELIYKLQELQMRI